MLIIKENLVMFSVVLREKVVVLGEMNKAGSEPSRLKSSLGMSSLGAKDLYNLNKI